METVERLYAEAASVLEEVGHEQLSIRVVAARAGVSPATAYTYFASKDHLFAELFLRHIESAGGIRATGDTPTARLQQWMRQIAALISEAPALAAAANRSMLGTDPEVERLRLVVGSLWDEAFRQAIGPDVEVEPRVLMTLRFALSGALLQAGAGMFNAEKLGDYLADAVDVIMNGAD
jgi:AcrR family transcriptional regulator